MSNPSSNAVAGENDETLDPAFDHVMLFVVTLVGTPRPSKP